MGGRQGLPYDRRVEIELSVTFAPELGEAVSAAADEAGLSLSEWLSQAAEAKLNADRDAGIGEYLDEWEAQHGAFTEEELAEAAEKLGWPWPPADESERA